MNRTGPRPAALLSALAIVLFMLTACSTDNSGTTTASTVDSMTTTSTNDGTVSATDDSVTSASTDDGTVRVTIKSFKFAPNPIKVSVGESVMWTNEDWVGHTVTARDDSFRTGTFYADDSVTVTFRTAGTFAYFCSVPTHRGMSGTVIVEPAA
jgi:plastocyanin